MNNLLAYLIAQDTYIPSVIPKSSLLPGPAEGSNYKNVLVDIILPNLAVWLLGIVGGISLLFLIISGVRFATAYGNEENIKKAKEQAKYSLIGLVIAMLSYTIVTIVINLKYEENKNQPQTLNEPATDTSGDYEPYIMPTTPTPGRILEPEIPTPDNSATV